LADGQAGGSLSGFRMKNIVDGDRRVENMEKNYAIFGIPGWGCQSKKEKWSCNFNML
jgi:hypothetical protein